MEVKEFLEKYGNEKVYFTGMYKFRAMYENKELGIYCSGVIEYRGDISYEETVNSVFDLEYFQFGVKYSVSGSNCCKQCGKEIDEPFRFCSGVCKEYYYR